MGSIKLKNGYSIEVEKEKISHIGRSIYRELDEEQVVFRIVDQNGKVTKRLPIPAQCASEVAALLSIR
jgi:hypothetical protein